jgi:hypothetical protein
MLVDVISRSLIKSSYSIMSIINDCNVKFAKCKHDKMSHGHLLGDYSFLKHFKNIMIKKLQLKKNFILSCEGLY